MAIFTDVPAEDLTIGFSKHLTFEIKIVKFLGTLEIIIVRYLANDMLRFYSSFQLM